MCLTREDDCVPLASAAKPSGNAAAAAFVLLLGTWLLFEGGPRAIAGELPVRVIRGNVSLTVTLMGAFPP